MYKTFYKFSQLSSNDAQSDDNFELDKRFVKDLQNRSLKNSPS